MIANLSYGSYFKGAIDYILDEKKKPKILGYGNIVNTELSLPIYKMSMDHLSNRREASDKIMHLSLSLSPEDKLTDAKFYELSKEFMHEFGYGDQPFIVVQHNDRQHNHVHILSTRIKHEGDLIQTFQDRIRTKNISRSLEIKYGLQQLSRSNHKNELKEYLDPEFLLSNIDLSSTEQTKYYLDDITNKLLKSYNIRSLNEFKSLLKEYHIKVIEHYTNDDKNVIKGISFGIISQDEKVSQKIIPGSKIHKKLSYPELNKLFERNNSNKLLKSYKFRLKRKITERLECFDTINKNDLKAILKLFDNIDIEYQKSKEGNVIGYKIKDYTKYNFNASEVDRNLTISKNVKISDSNTKVKDQNTLLSSLLDKELQTAFNKFSIQKENWNIYQYKLLEGLRFDTLKPYLESSEAYLSLLNLNLIKPSDLNQQLNFAFDKLIEKRSTLKNIETKQLLNKSILIKKILNQENLEPYKLIQSLGLVYNNFSLSDRNHNEINMPFKLGKVTPPKELNNFLSSGFIANNTKMLNYLFGIEKEVKFNSSAFYLPMIFPSIYENLSPEITQKFEDKVIPIFLKDVVKKTAIYQKNPEHFIEHLNAKKVFIIKDKSKFYYRTPLNNSKYEVEVSTANYLKQLSNDSKIFEDQTQKLYTLNTPQDKRNHLNQLWVTQLIENGIYDKAAYLMDKETINPLIHQEVYDYHLKNGLQKQLNDEKLKSINNIDKKEYSKSSRKIKGIYNGTGGNYEAYNGFKDELTDYSKGKIIDI
ncbi:hypothetical protein FHS04_002788 [Mesoflavibacter sabulilitoris]|uniref:MobA/VirD2-like nuclease domain-containing protein n=1 Tax=Mesoflavibacter zeaxanthinifaciens subsp. sabulilitoris TaxID=1520893 RepID=A0A2T1NNK2_9FLAO|nr:relaxase/mobilization nuclease domain-containing protein [Mesoflavibacter zeaxanthinifaciens]MBB3125244.1 hypothetical protein [Mesoflavibacter zeaxanthinifaciens subsp. sabulilitoris]PSG94479.1 hypothetical protein C7H61_00670 [Mesoflavibacter zeaxanthinifaciens subsp. sabulilitoris]